MKYIGIPDNITIVPIPTSTGDTKHDEMTRKLQMIRYM